MNKMNLGDFPLEMVGESTLKALALAGFGDAFLVIAVVTHPEGRVCTTSNLPEEEQAEFLRFLAQQHEERGYVKATNRSVQ